MIRPQYRFVFATIVLCGFLWAVVGCRTPVSVEGNLRAEPFLVDHASLTKDSGGQLFAVAGRGQVPQRFATVEYNDQKHLFWALRNGDRSVQLLPLTRFDIDWYNQAMQQPANLRFYDEADELAVSDTLGLWRGGNEERIRWLGPIPGGEYRAVVVPADVDLESMSLPELIVGTVDIDGDGIVNRHRTFAPHTGPYLVIPDGITTTSAPRAASLAGATFDFDGLQGWVWQESSGSEDLPSQADLQQRAGELGVEFLVTRRGEDLALGFAADAGPPGYGPWGRRAALVESGILLDSEASNRDRRSAMQAMDDLYKGHPLSAAYQLARASNWSVYHNSESTLLRHQDLVAAGGFIPWMRAASLEGKEGIGPELSLYLGRAFAYEGHKKAALSHGSRAHRLFGEWPGDEGGLGQAQSRVLEADLYLAAGDTSEGIRALRQAHNGFQRGEDAYRAALIERRIGLLNAEESDFVPIADAFSELSATYEAARTLLLASAALIEREELETATQTLEQFNDRHGSDASGTSDRLQLLAQALTTRINWLQGEQLNTRQLSEQARRAQDLHAWEAVVVFGLTHHGYQATADEADIRTLGNLLVEGSLRSGTALFEGSVNQTLGVICADVVFAAKSETRATMVDRNCGQRIRQFMASPDGVLALLEGGYRFLQRGELDAASDLEEFLFSELPEADGWAFARASALLYRAALAGEMSSDLDYSGEDAVAVDAIQKAFDLLRKDLAPRSAPAVLLEMGDDFHARGFDTLTVSLYRASRQAAINANRSSAQFEAALKLAEALYRYGDFEQLAQMDNVASPLHATRIDLYRGHAQYFRDNRGMGAQLTEEALRQAEEFGDLQHISVLHLAAELAMARGDMEEAAGLVERALNRLDSLPESLTNREESRVLLARARARKARLLYADEQDQEARDSVQIALEILEELSPSAAPQIRHEVLVTAADLAESREAFDDYVQRLDDVSRRLPDDLPAHYRRDIVQSLSRLLVERDDPRSAMSRVRSVLGEGRALASSRNEHHCTVGSVRLFSGDRSGGHFHLAKCAAAGSSESAARAQLLRALSDGDATSNYRAGLVRHLHDTLPASAVGERARLQWMAALAEPRMDVDQVYEDALREAFRAEPDEDHGPRQTLRAAVEFIEYLIDTAQYEEADRLLQSESGVFYAPEVDAEDLWVRLRITSMVRQLRPFDVFGYMDRAVSEAPANTDEGEAEFHYLRAVAHLQAGQYFPAAASLARAQELAEPFMGVHERLQELESTLDLTRSAR